MESTFLFVDVPILLLELVLMPFSGLRTRHNDKSIYRSGPILKVDTEIDFFF